MSAFPYADAEEAVLDTALRVLLPEDAPDDGDLDGSGWQVTNEESAAWAIKKIKHARSVARRRNAPALEVIAEYEAAIHDLRRTVEANEKQAQVTVDFFTVCLIVWHRRQWLADDDPKHRTTNTIRIAGGELRSRQLPSTCEVDDPAALLAAATKAEADFCTTEIKPDKAAIKRWVKQTGEIPPGARINPGDRKWEVVL